MLLLLSALAVAKDKPQDARATIAARPDDVKAYFLHDFTPYGYSIDSDVPAQLQLSRPMSTMETMEWQTSHWIVGANGAQCRRQHTFLLLSGEKGTDVTMRWETICAQPRGGQFRSVNANKKEVQWMVDQLAAAKAKLEAHQPEAAK